jgi:hypothetical protein
MKRLLASYRWRRRLAWLTAAVLVVAAVVAASLKWNTVPKRPQGPSNVPLRIDNTSPKPVRLKRHDERQMLAVVSRFIHTAVARKHVDRSWELASAELRAGFSRKQWDTGDMPVVPYPVGRAELRLEYLDTQGVGYSVSLSAAKGSHRPQQDFLLGLHPLGSGKRRHWVVDYWQSAPGGGTAAASAGASGANGPVGTPKEGKIWLLVPVGLLSLIILVPFGIIILNWYRGRRAARAILRP